MPSRSLAFRIMRPTHISRPDWIMERACALHRHIHTGEAETGGAEGPILPQPSLPDKSNKPATTRRANCRRYSRIRTPTPAPLAKYESTHIARAGSPAPPTRSRRQEDTPANKTQTLIWSGLYSPPTPRKTPLCSKTHGPLLPSLHSSNPSFQRVHAARLCGSEGRCVFGGRWLKPERFASSTRPGVARPISGGEGNIGEAGGRNRTITSWHRGESRRAAVGGARAEAQGRGRGVVLSASCNCGEKTACTSM